jgi:hypothetical protein
LKKYLLRLCHIACAVVLVCHLNSCKDPAIADKNNSLGFDPIGLAHIDTTPVILNTIAEIPLQSSAVTTGVLGSMDDGLLFGKTYCGFYAQPLLSSNGAYFESGTVIDSMVLYMPYINDSSKYGPCKNAIDILVYEVSQYMDPTVVYHQSDAFSVYSQPIGRLNSYKPDLIDSSVIRHFTVRPTICIKLSSAFAQKLLATNFVNYLKGIYVTTNPANIGDGISYLDLQSSRISMYYHTATSDSLQFDFPINSYSATVNHFDHQNSGTAVQAAINNPGSNGDPKVYIQSGSGSKLKLKIPGLSTLPKNIAVTKAELILPVQTTDTAQFPLPRTITLYRIDNASDTSSTYALNVYNKSGVASLTTRKDDAGLDYYCYVFNLTEFIQRVQNGYYGNYGFFISYSYTVRANRAIILNNPAQSGTQSKLKITYTKLQ